MKKKLKISTQEELDAIYGKALYEISSLTIKYTDKQNPIDITSVFHMKNLQYLDLNGCFFTYAKDVAVENELDLLNILNIQDSSSSCLHLAFLHAMPNLKKVIASSSDEDDDSVIYSGDRLTTWYNASKPTLQQLNMDNSNKWKGSLIWIIIFGVVSVLCSSHALSITYELKAEAKDLFFVYLISYFISILSMFIFWYGIHRTIEEIKEEYSFVLSTHVTSWGCVVALISLGWWGILYSERIFMQGVFPTFTISFFMLIGVTVYLVGDVYEEV